MSSSLKNVCLAFAGVTALAMFSPSANAQFLNGGTLENYQGIGHGKKCSGGHTGVPASKDARLRTAKRQDSEVASQLRIVPKVTLVAHGAESPEDVAARQLTQALELKAEADLALQSKEPARANKLRERVEDRLNLLVAKYSDTEAANEAIVLLKQYREK
jgi:hypothetical protein